MKLTKTYLLTQLESGVTINNKPLLFNKSYAFLQTSNLLYLQGMYVSSKQKITASKLLDGTEVIVMPV